MHYIHFQL